MSAHGQKSVNHGGPGGGGDDPGAPWLLEPARRRSIFVMIISLGELSGFWPLPTNDDLARDS